MQGQIGGSHCILVIRSSLKDVPYAENFKFFFMFGCYAKASSEFLIYIPYNFIALKCKTLRSSN